MCEIFEALIHLAAGVGNVTSAMMYDNGFMTVEGKTADGKKYSVTLNIKEDESKEEEGGNNWRKQTKIDGNIMY